MTVGKIKGVNYSQALLKSLNWIKDIKLML